MVKRNEFLTKIQTSQPRQSALGGLYVVVLAQLVRASACGAEGRRFEPGIPPITQQILNSKL